LIRTGSWAETASGGGESKIEFRLDSIRKFREKIGRYFLIRIHKISLFAIFNLVAGNIDDFSISCQHGETNCLKMQYSIHL